MQILESIILTICLGSYFVMLLLLLSSNILIFGTSVFSFLRQFGIIFPIASTQIMKHACVPPPPLHLNLYTNQTLPSLRLPQPIMAIAETSSHCTEKQHRRYETYSFVLKFYVLKLLVLVLRFKFLN